MLGDSNQERERKVFGLERKKDDFTYVLDVKSLGTSRQEEPRGRWYTQPQPGPF